MPCLLQFLLSLQRGFIRRFSPPVRLFEQALRILKRLSLHFLPRDVVHFCKDLDIFLSNGLDMCLLLCLVLLAPGKHLESDHTTVFGFRAMAALFGTIHQCLGGLHSRLIESDIACEVERTGQLWRGPRLESERFLEL
jgi:hypothetical protein